LIALAVIVALGGLTLAAMASRRGDEAMGFSICAVTGLLVSPVSWNHHWTLAVPALLVLAVRAYRRRSKLGLIAAGAIVVVGYSYLPEVVANAYPGGLGLPVGWTLLSDSYVLIGVLVLVAACAQEYRVGLGRSPR
jgi:alpha-1,2-mannosyltransferase